MLNNTPKSALVFLGLMAVAMLAGCTEEVAIRKYTVAKTDVQRVRPSSGSAGAEQRMLGAIVPRDDSAWYLKMVDEPDKIEQYESDFRRMIESLSFDEQGEPQLQISSDWDQQYERQITYLRLTHKKAGVSATLSQLPAPTESEETWRDRVNQDVNRWRGQVSLQPLDWESMQAELVEVPELKHGPAKAYYVSMTGKKSASGMSAPFLQGMGMSAPAASPPVVATSAEAPAAESISTPASQPLQYDVPDGWSEEEAAGIRLATFTVAGDGVPATVSVSTASGDPAMFLDMWFGQAGKEGTEAAKQQVLDQAETLTVNGVEATVYTIEGTEDKALLVSRVPWKANEALFAKMTGTPQQLGEHRDQFLEFVNSLRW